ncbi:nuclear transport factor 2 family protein [Planomonospora sp. ID67723]|uniref:nuclear transport factor 2 family protein n=1 Tax=Planomonospora sp. ID67723 TaxID=2738134 RepID=UPI0018C39416|nr:nuclear transport factor 2 family protein [Planomonospora sp. ID67723]MBG0831456.1 nuclear transport factor 2 family protein [Planomonospora sp. ID67723]
MNDRGTRTRPRTHATIPITVPAVAAVLIIGATVSCTTPDQAGTTPRPHDTTEMIMPAASGDDLDRSAILDNYRSQHRAMVEARTDVLDALLADQFTATHITGYQQPKAEWLAQIRSGDFTYHRIEDKDVFITVDGDSAVLVGRAAVTVTIGGARGTWNLESTMEYIKQGGRWTVVRSRSTTYQP